MTIDEAIVTLDDWRRDNCPPPLADEFNALHLGIAALKREKERRSYAQNFNYQLLPGETEE